MSCSGLQIVPALHSEGDEVLGELAAEGMVAMTAGILGPLVVVDDGLVDTAEAIDNHLDMDKDLTKIDDTLTIHVHPHIIVKSKTPVAVPFINVP